MNEAEVKTHLPEITALTKELGTDAMVAWSEDKKKDFVNKFDERVRVSQYLNLRTASQIQTAALHKHFISAKHTEDRNDFQVKIEQLKDKQGWGPLAPNNLGGYYQRYTALPQVGGRPLVELDKIAEERVEQILQNLPPLKDAVSIISPSVSAMIEERDILLEEGKELMNEAKELAGELNLADIDQEMTVGAFRKYVKDRIRKRDETLAKMNDCGKEASRLDSKINKFLFAGLPGLSQAVVDVITNLDEKATALGTMNRRVGEKVMFGESAAAVSLLQNFEQDEVKVSDEVKAQFDRALETLKLAGAKKPTRALKKGK